LIFLEKDAIIIGRSARNIERTITGSKPCNKE
jgi:hypothetical protein